MSAAMLGFVKGFADKRTELIEKEKEKRNTFSSLLQKMHLKGIEKQQELYVKKQEGWNKVRSALDSGDLQGARFAAAQVSGVIDNAKELKQAGAPVDLEAMFSNWDEDTLRSAVSEFDAIEAPSYTMTEDYFPAYQSKERELFDKVLGGLFGIDAKNEYIPSSRYGRSAFTAEEMEKIAAADEDEREGMMESMVAGKATEQQFPTVSTSPVFEDKSGKSLSTSMQTVTIDGKQVTVPTKVTESGLQIYWQGQWTQPPPDAFVKQTEWKAPSKQDREIIGYIRQAYFDRLPGMIEEATGEEKTRLSNIAVYAENMDLTDAAVKYNNYLIEKNEPYGVDSFVEFMEQDYTKSITGNEKMYTLIFTDEQGTKKVIENTPKRLVQERVKELQERYGQYGSVVVK